MWISFFNEFFNTSIYEIVSKCEQYHSVDLCFLSEGHLVELKGFSLFFCEWAESKAKACWISSLLSVVSKSPGVSTTVTGRPQASPLSIWHVLVTDIILARDSNTSRPRMVFPVALFPTPVFPIRILTHFKLFSVPNVAVKSQTQMFSLIKGVMNWETKILLIFWNIRGHCTIKTSCKFQNSKLLH